MATLDAALTPAHPELLAPADDVFLDKGMQPVFRWSHSGAKGYKVGIYHPGGWISYSPRYPGDWYESSGSCIGEACSGLVPPLYKTGEYFWWLVTLDDNDCGYRVQPGGFV